jgi:phosphonate transport system permease protein
VTATTSTHPPDLVAPATGPASRRRFSAGHGWVVALAVVVVWSVGATGIGREPVVNPYGWPTMRAFWVAAVHPDLSPALLTTVVDSALTTVAFALLGTVLAVVIGLVGGVLISEVWWLSRPSAGAVTRVRRRAGWLVGRVGLGVPRGIHEAVWGLFLVSVLGRDPMVGVLAIAIPFGAITAKVYAEIIDEFAGAPHRALLDAGASRLSAIVYAAIPRSWRDLVSYGFYRFDCAIRAAVILGMVGSGGLGFELALTFQALRYEQMWTLIYALVILGVIVDWWGASLRTDASTRWMQASMLLGGALTVASVLYLGPDLQRLFSNRTWTLLVDLVSRALPPRPPISWPDLLGSALATLQMSILAIAVGSAVGVATAFLAARDPHHGPIRALLAAAARLLLLTIRAISPPVWALVLLFVFLPGPLPGAIALGIYNAGILGRLFAEVVEDLDRRPAAALRASGATAAVTFLYGLLPLAANRFAAYSMYRWEIAIRESVVVGVVGAVGLGRLLEEQRAAFDYQGMLCVVIVLLLLSLAVDLVSAAARRAWR